MKFSAKSCCGFGPLCEKNGMFLQKSSDSNLEFSAKSCCGFGWKLHGPRNSFRHANKKPWLWWHKYSHQNVLIHTLPILQDLFQFSYEFLNKFNNFWTSSIFSIHWEDWSVFRSLMKKRKQNHDFACRRFQITKCGGRGKHNIAAVPSLLVVVATELVVSCGLQERVTHLVSSSIFEEGCF